jgi:hypothetical protein
MVAFLDADGQLLDGRLAIAAAIDMGDVLHIDEVGHGVRASGEKGVRRRRAS